MKKLLLLALLVTSLFAREYIAIIDFEGIGISYAEARVLTQRLTSEMIALEVYQVLERSEMKRLLDEQKFQYSGCVDMKCAVEVGKMLGAKFMVVGTTSKFGNSFSIDSRLIDVETSEAYVSATFIHNGEIEALLTTGISSIAKQLCELENNPQYNETLSKGKSIQTDIDKISIDEKKQYHCVHCGLVTGTDMSNQICDRCEPSENTVTVIRTKFDMKMLAVLGIILIMPFIVPFL